MRETVAIAALAHAGHAPDAAQRSPHQKQPAIFPSVAAAPAPASASGVAPVPSGTGSTPVLLASLQGAQPMDSAAAATTTAATVPAPVPVWAFPKDKLEKEFAYTIPTAKIPVSVTFDESLLAKGDAARGKDIYSKSSCIGCHAIAGTPFNMANVGPNLTHVGTRYTIAGGLYQERAGPQARQSDAHAGQGAHRSEDEDGRERWRSL